MKRKLAVPLVFLVILLIAAILGGGYYYYTHYYLPAGVPPLQPPLAAVEFPTAQIQYPAGWPEELKYPDEFMLVDASSGSLSEETNTAWSAKIRYGGLPSEALKTATAFFETKGWTIVETSPLDSGGFSLLMQRGQGSGIVVIDTDPNDSTRSLLVATIFP